jgi:hypothetical protein
VKHGKKLCDREVPHPVPRTTKAGIHRSMSALRPQKPPAITEQIEL